MSSYYLNDIEKPIEQNIRGVFEGFALMTVLTSALILGVFITAQFGSWLGSLITFTGAYIVFAMVHQLMLKDLDDAFERDEDIAEYMEDAPYEYFSDAYQEY